jgi:hypothetical protein
MAASDRGDNNATTFPKTRAEDSTANVGVPTARQSISHLRASSAHDGFSVTDRPSTQG